MTSPLDQEARNRTLDPEESFHLEAPAGSGKTAVLLSRFLLLLARVEETPLEILALTFTRKAAGEFRERAMKYFWARPHPAADTPPHEQRLMDLAAQAFRHLDRKNLIHRYLLAPERLPVTTFHGFCAQLLKAAPHEAGVPLDFQILESDREAEWQKQEALEELRRRLSARPETDPVRRALVRRLVRLNNNWPRLARELRDLLARRDTLTDFLALAHQSLQESAYAELMATRLSGVVLHHLQPLAAGLAHSELGRRWPEFRERASLEGAAAALPPDPPGAKPQDVGAWHHLAGILLTKSGELRKKWPKGLAGTAWPLVLQEMPPDFWVRLKDCRNLPLELISAGEVGALQDLILLLYAAWEVYEDLCRQRRVLDFIALEGAALRLLREENPTDLLLRLDRRLRHVLVDEFQDTSDNQMELLCRLRSGWTPGDGRTLTVVGDPKQSIYGWRQARLRLFLESRQGLHCDGRVAWPLSPLHLTTNFRATEVLIHWVNRVFGGAVMADREVAGGLEFIPAQPRPGATGGESPCLALFGGEDRDEAREREARWLAQQVAQEQERLPPREGMAVLLFSRTHLARYLAALQAAGLVPRVREGLLLTDSPVVRHLHNLARALVRPQDDVAWAAVLTGPWLAPDLASLAASAQAPGEVWPEKLAAWAATSPGPGALSRLLSLLLAARGRVGREPLADTLGRFLEESGAWNGLAAWEGALGVACARTYLNLLREAEGGVPETTFQKTAFALEEARQPPDPRAENSPVEVLTVHGAKGLEFHTVFLPYLDWRPLGMGGAAPPPFLLEEIPESGAPVLALAPPTWQTGQDFSHRLVKGLRNQRLLAEARRVFYVAVTRAQARLFLSGVFPQSRGGWAPPSGDSPLAWLWRHYQPQDLSSGEAVLWPDPPLRVEVSPPPPPLAPPARALHDLPTSWELRPEPPPYTLAFPSQAVGRFGDEGLLGGAAPAGEEDNLEARARGEVLHRLLATLAQGGGLPEAAGIAAALVGLGLEGPAAAGLAPEILAEARACAQDPFLRNLLASGALRCEWLLEDQPAAGVIRRGRLDLLAYAGGEWWLVDFKTSRPPAGDHWQDFLLREKEQYRPQLLAYRDMVARLRGIAPPEAIRLALYFTASRELVEV